MAKVASWQGSTWAWSQQYSIVKFCGVRYCGHMWLHDVGYENGRCHYCVMKVFWILILEVLCILCCPLAFVMVDVLLW